MIARISAQDIAPKVEEGGAWGPLGSSQSVPKFPPLAPNNGGSLSFSCGNFMRSQCILSPTFALRPYPRLPVSISAVICSGGASLLGYIYTGRAWG